MARDDSTHTNSATESAEPLHSTDMIYSPEIGENITAIEAVREKVRLHPHAQTNEIQAMFELDGAKISVSLIQRVKEEEAREGWQLR